MANNPEGWWGCEFRDMNAWLWRPSKNVLISLLFKTRCKARYVRAYGRGRLSRNVLWLSPTDVVLDDEATIRVLNTIFGFSYREIRFLPVYILLSLKHNLHFKMSKQNNLMYLTNVRSFKLVAFSGFSIQVILSSILHGHICGQLHADWSCPTLC